MATTGYWSQKRGSGMINHSKKFIFVHIDKTGGTSIERTIAKQLKTRFVGPQHEHIIDLLKKRNGEGYFKFAVVRNPWSRCVSRYFSIKAKDTPREAKYKNTTFRDFVLNEGNYFKLSSPWAQSSPILSQLVERYDPFLPQTKWIADHRGEILVDFVARFENLQEDYDFICNKIGIPKTELPHLNKSAHAHYTTYYDDETRKIIEERFKEDIENFKYKFGVD